jgi:hypothetical protein
MDKLTHYGLLILAGAAAQERWKMNAGMLNIRFCESKSVELPVYSSTPIKAIWEAGDALENIIESEMVELERLTDGEGNSIWLGYGERTNTLCVAGFDA